MHAETFAERIEARMNAEGYTDIEVDIVDDKLKVEGKKDGRKLKIVYFSATEEVLFQNVEEEDDKGGDDDLYDEAGKDSDEDEDVTQNNK